MTGAMVNGLRPAGHAGDRLVRRVLWVMKGLGLGGAERLAASCARHFDRAKVAVEIAYVLPHKDALTAELRDAGIRVHSVGTPGASVGWIRPLVRLVRRGGFDLVHTHSPVPALPLRMIPRGQRPPMVHTEHNTWGRYRRSTRAANAVTYGANEAVLTVSDGVRASLAPPRCVPSSRFPDATTLHHGIDPQSAVRGDVARARARRKLGLPPHVRVIGTVGNLTPKKDQASMIAATRQLAESHPDIRLVIVGSGPLEPALRRQIRQARLECHVILTGSRADVPSILPAFDAFALSSLHEGLSIALLEAMAAGVPPVATAVGGVPEVITDGVDGLLVPARAPSQLASALRRVLDDKDLHRTLATAAERRSHDFGITRAVRFMEQWYERVLS